MKHLFVPYELAVIAKEKGFNEPCLAYYQLKFDEDKEPFKNAELSFFKERYDNNNFRLERHPSAGHALCTAPLYQQLVDWFREEHRIFIAENIKKSIKYSCYIFEVYDLNTCKNESGSDNYHIALKNAIEEAFKLI